MGNQIEQFRYKMGHFYVLKGVFAGLNSLNLLQIATNRHQNNLISRRDSIRLFDAVSGRECSPGFSTDEPAVPVGCILMLAGFMTPA